jgi:hypothetical protein
MGTRSAAEKKRQNLGLSDLEANRRRGQDPGKRTRTAGLNEPSSRTKELNRRPGGEGNADQRAGDWSMTAELSAALGLGEETPDCDLDARKPERELQRSDGGDSATDGATESESYAPGPGAGVAEKDGVEEQETRHAEPVQPERDASSAGAPVVATEQPRDDGPMDRAVAQNGGDATQGVAQQARAHDDGVASDENRAIARPEADTPPASSRPDSSLAPPSPADSSSASDSTEAPTMGGAGVDASPGPIGGGATNLAAPDDPPAPLRGGAKESATPLAVDDGKAPVQATSQTSAEPSANQADDAPANAPDVAERGEDDARDTTATGPAQPREADAPVPKNGTSLAFAESDVEQLVPPTLDEAPEDRAQRVADARDQLAQDKTYAVAQLTEFRAAQGQRIATLSQLAPKIEQSLCTAEQHAAAQIVRATATQEAAVQTEVTRAIGQAQAAASAARVRIQATFTAAQTAIQTATTTARTQLTASYQQAVSGARSAETAQLSEVSRLYGQAETAFRVSASAAGSHATTVAAARARTYRAGRINRDDSFLDGPLTDNRCEARAEAAEKVGQAYSEELGKEGDNQVAEMRKRKPQDESAVRQIAEEARRNLETTHRESLRSLDESARHALTSAA